MFSRFIIEESGQGVIETILVLGGVVFSISVVIRFYIGMATSTGNKLEKAVQPISESFQNINEPLL